MDGYHITTDLEEMDFESIYQFISSTYWAEGIPRETFHTAISNSWCFGILSDSGEQIGFARLITDRATFAYLADVYIIESHRGRGLAKWLIKTIIDQPETGQMRRLLLATRDAHGLYAKFGFQNLESADLIMQIWRREIYRKS